MFKWLRKNKTELQTETQAMTRYTQDFYVKCWLTCFTDNKPITLHPSIYNEEALNHALPIAQEQWYNAHPPRNIGEPVLSILKAMRERPDTFEVGYTKQHFSFEIEVEIHDTVTGWVGAARAHCNQHIGYAHSPRWMTKDEVNALIEASIHFIENEQSKKKQEQRDIVMKMYNVEEK